MIEYIDFEKRLSCEEHLVLFCYSMVKNNKHKNCESCEISEADFKDLVITESLINEYSSKETKNIREEVENVMALRKKDLDILRAKYEKQIWEYEKPVIWADRTKSAYYIENLKESHKFEVYIDYLFKQHGYDIGLFYGKSQQYNQGETSAGIEIKCDKMLRKTGNVYIEYKERLNKYGNWVDSGILKKDQTNYFLIGTIEEFYIIPRENLLKYYKRLVENKEKISGMRVVEELKHGTSKGFVMSRQWAKKDSISVEEVVRMLKKQ